jgi:hypothetical protein
MIKMRHISVHGIVLLYLVHGTSTLFVHISWYESSLYIVVLIYMRQFHMSSPGRFQREDIEKIEKYFTPTIPNIDLTMCF